MEQQRKLRKGVIIWQNSKYRIVQNMPVDLQSESELIHSLRAELKK